MSKGLESLNKLQHDLDHKLKGDKLVECYENIYHELKALEILKEKLTKYNVDMAVCENTHEKYIEVRLEYESERTFLTEEEFNILKEALADD